MNRLETIEKEGLMWKVSIGPERNVSSPRWILDQTMALELTGVSVSLGLGYESIGFSIEHNAGKLPCTVVTRMFGRVAWSNANGPARVV